MGDRIDQYAGNSDSNNDDMSTWSGVASAAWKELDQEGQHQVYAYDASRFGVAGVTALKGTIEFTAGSVIGSQGAIAYPFHQIGRMIGLATEQDVHNDKEALREGADYYTRSATALAYGVYTLIFGPPKIE